MTIRRFLRGTRAAATAIAAAAVTVMTVGGAALVSDHVWLVDQRDALKSASEAAGVAATLEMGHLMDTQPGISDADLETKLSAVARRYIMLNLQHLSADRLARATSTLVVTIVPNRAQRTVDVSVEADLGGTILSRHMPLLGEYEGSGTTRVATQVESVTNPIEVVLAIDVSESMKGLLSGSSCRTCPDNRISIVKRAAANLVDILEPSADNRVAVGVVPWHTVVRLDSQATADWARDGWAAYPTRRVYGEPYACYGTGCTPPAAVEQALAATSPEPWKGCLDSHRMGSVGTRASLPATSEFFSLPSDNAFAQLYFRASQASSYECLPLPLPADFYWQICFHGDKYSRGSTTAYAPFEPQRECEDTDPAILPLSTDGDAIKLAIDALEPIGLRTYSALGTLWGQRLLTHSWNATWGGGVHPVDPDARESDGLRKAIVLLTDGEDTHCGLTNSTCADSVLGYSRADACTAVKAAGTEIFVIAAMHPDKVSDTLGDSLRECSSESDDSDVKYAFLNHSTPEGLEATFATIANQLRVVRRVY